MYCIYISLVFIKRTYFDPLIQLKHNVNPYGMSPIYNRILCNVIKLTLFINNININSISVSPTTADTYVFMPTSANGTKCYFNPRGMLSRLLIIIQCLLSATIKTPGQKKIIRSHEIVQKENHVLIWMWIMLTSFTYIVPKVANCVVNYWFNTDCRVKDKYELWINNIILFHLWITFWIINLSWHVSYDRRTNIDKHPNSLINPLAIRLNSF